MSKFMTLADAKDQFSAVTAEANATHERIIVTRHGQPHAVILSHDDYESLLETLDVLSDRDLTVSLLEPINETELVAWSVVQADLDSRDTSGE